MKTIFERKIMSFHTDTFGVVHHARHLEILEEARWHYCDENKLMQEYHQRKIIHLIANINIDYKSSAHLGDLVRVESEVFRVTEKSVVYRQTLSCHDKVLAIAEITNVYLFAEDRKTVPVESMKGFWSDLERNR